MFSLNVIQHCTAATNAFIHNDASWFYLACRRRCIIACTGYAYHTLVGQALLLYLHEKEPHDETGPLAVAHLTVVQWVRLHHVEQTLLSQSILLLEEVVLRICACYVPSDHLLACRRRLDVVSILLLDGGVMSAAQQLPHDASEVMRHSLPNQFLNKDRRRSALRRPRRDWMHISLEAVHHLGMQVHLAVLLQNLGKRLHVSVQIHNTWQAL